MTTRPPRSRARASPCSWSITKGCSLPGTGRGCHFDATSTPARPPVAITTASGAMASTSPAVASKPSRMSTPRRARPPPAAPGQARGQADLAAELLAPLEEGHVVAARGSHPCRLETGGATADDNHAFAARCLLQRGAQLDLPADRGVGDARDRQALGEVPVATLVAAGARADGGVVP